MVLSLGPTVWSGFLHWVCFHAIEWPLSVGHTIWEAALKESGLGVTHTLDRAIQKSPVAELSHVLLEVLGIGENLSTLLESLGVGQVGSSQPTGIPHTAQWERKVLVTDTVCLIKTHEIKNIYIYRIRHIHTYTQTSTYAHRQTCKQT